MDEELLRKYQQLERDTKRLLNLYLDTVDVIIQVHKTYPMILKDVLGEEKMKEFLKARLK